MSVTIVWFRQDLRLTDHAALQAAVARGGAIVPVFVWDTASAEPWAPGGASRWWLHHSLAALAETIQSLGGRLLLRSGDTLEQLSQVAEATGASAVFFNAQFEPYSQPLERSLHEHFSDQGITVKRYPGQLLFQPSAIHTKDGTPYKVFTPFWKACLSSEPPQPPLPAQQQIAWYDKPVDSDELADWALTPTQPNWAEGFSAGWQPGEAAALAKLDAFIDDAINAYDEQRDVPAAPGTSRLSPHLHFGEVSPRQVWHAVQQAKANGASSADADRFLSEIGWREFSYHLLHHFPHLPDSAFNTSFQAFPWQGDDAALKAWQRGQTGIPLVDAGMRELWHTGWMHNRVRMVVGSFLVKNLLIHWREGERWFWDTLLDADLASNAASWQWVASSGADAAPYFRIFNPVTQSEKFDADGRYLRTWVPELAALPDKYIHKPWEAPESVLRDADISLGTTYPKPIVDLKASRQRALDAYQQMRSAD